MPCDLPVIASAGAPDRLPVGPRPNSPGGLGQRRRRGADRWADLAVATLSLGWNYPGRNGEAEFFTADGVAPEPTRIDYYRRLWRAFDHTSGAASR